MNVTIEFPRAALPPPKRWVGWRALHKIEGGRDIPTDVLPHPPAVVPDYTGASQPLTKDIQWMCYDLQRHFCDTVTRERWRDPLHSHAFAMTNKAAGFGYGVLLRDYINGLDLSATALPKYDKIRTFQGSFITGVLEGNLIWCQPGVHGIDARGFTYVPGTPAAAATLQKIIDNQWYSIAVAVGDPPFHIRAQWGAGCVIVFPFIFSQPIAFNSAFFAPWDETFLPDPVKVYR